MNEVRYKGKRLTLAELSRQHGIDLRTLKSRVQRGMSIEEALTTPLRRYPNGVQRPREVRHRPIEQVDVKDLPPACDRCARESNLTTVFGLTMCGICREQLATIAASWVNRG
jgi:hypothetical protein